MRCILHGSFTKHFEEIKKIHQQFTSAGIEVVAPQFSAIAAWNEGFALLEGQEHQDPRYVELQYLQNLKRLTQDGFSYFVNVDGYLGKSASYELGIAQVTNVRCFFLENIKDHPAYIDANSVWKPADLVDHILTTNSLPLPIIEHQDLHSLWEDLMVPGSIVATGAIIECGPEILLVKTHKWGGRFSIVGGKVRRNESLVQSLLREVKEETGLTGEVKDHLCTFDQIKNSGYYRQGIQHIYVDNIVKVESKKVSLNDEAEDYVWIPVQEALQTLDVEPNARHTLEIYLRHATSS